MSDVGTRTVTKEEIPDAYLVNFEDNEGFAVLGANTAVADIVAVTEGGQVTDDLTVILEENQNNELLEGEDDPYEIDENSIGWYCEEDDDFYSATTGQAAFMTECLKIGVIESREDNSGSYNSGMNSGSNSDIVGSYEEDFTPQIYTTKEPLLKTKWGQRDPYNKYCKRYNLIGQQKSAYTGCSTTAMAMIVAYNEFPQNLIICSNFIDWDQIKKEPYGQWLPEQAQEDIALLMGSIYNNVIKFATKKATMITPAQIAKRMRAFGYSNVKKHCGSDFTQSMIDATSDMLANNKPVFISAIPKKWRNGHSWVIDGAKYSSEEESRYLLHFNFGWSGASNGYFSTTCLNPGRAEEYDNMNIDNTTDKDYAYTWHFRLITYDIPTEIKTLNIGF